ncbi:MAG: hypothetical protein RMK64_09275 [Rhodovarius sp.]|nr:hypothetical protein [Rhodovarius sp.]MCX7931706.1 hypothetical protein [Rhodovarius sp.]MDW8315148.1 hypothetical protein [Rhodovarius sp.]
MARELVSLFAQEAGRALIQQHCQRVGLEVADLQRLVEEVIDKDSMGRRRGMRQVFDSILDTTDGEGPTSP